MNKYTAGRAMMNAATPEGLLEACDDFEQAVTEAEQRERVRRAVSRGVRQVVRPPVKWPAAAVVLSH